MLKLKDILERLNRLTIGYNITWDDVKYDADRAVDRINSYLGAAYPPMSEILSHPDATYSIRQGRRDIAIFEDIYIINIVIPFIAMEVLARDEEFTTVFNKYASDVDNNLFTMFQREYNRIPAAFLQQGPVGVFFPDSSPQAVHLRRQQPVDFAFRVYYHLNNADLMGSVMAPQDTKAYKYKQTAQVLSMNIPKIISTDGVYAYTFEGWYHGSLNGPLVEGEVTLTNDVHLYAKWTKEYTLNTAAGALSIKPEFAGMLTQLVIPAYINGIKSLKITSDMFLNTPLLQDVTLPGTVIEIMAEGFRGFNGRRITIPVAGDVLAIQLNAFKDTPNLHNIYLPYRVRIIATDAFPAQYNTLKTIHCEILEQNKPGTWSLNWFNPIGNTVVWGSHGT